MDEETLDSVAEAIRTADRTVALTGAGVSTASGVPAFRTEGGVWDRHDPSDFHRRRFDADPEGFWTDRVDLREDMYDSDVAPNVAHEALADLEAAGQLDCLVTQNVDGLHQAAGSESVIELHGSHARVVCDDCGRTQPADPVFERARDGERPPRCEACDGVLKPDVVLFGEQLPDQAFDRAQREARGCDVFLAVGSSLSVRPASLLPEVAADSGATFVIVNLERTEVSDRADYELLADVTDALPAIAERLADGG